MALFDSKDKIEKILKSSQIGLWKVEFEEGSLPRFYADSVMDELMGTPEGISPEERFVFHHNHILGEDLAMFEEYSNRLVAGRAEVVYRYVHPERGELYVRCGGMRNLEETNFICIEGTHQDITNTMRLEKDKVAEIRLYEKTLMLEKEQHNTEDFFENLIRIQSCGIVAYEYLTNKLMIFNDKARELYDMPKDTPESEIVNCLRNVIYDNEAETKRKLHSLVDQKGAVNYTIQIRHKDGSSVHVLAATQLIVTDNGQSVVVSSLQDISMLTDLQETNNRLEEQLDIIKALGNSYSSIYYINMDDLSFFEIGATTDVNAVIGMKGNAEDSFCSMLKYIVEDDFVLEMKAFTDMSTISERLREKSSLRKQFKSKISGWSEGTFIAAKRDAEGNCTRVIWATTNINDTKEIEEEYKNALIKATMAAQSANEAKTSFLFNMSHDIRTPMNAIIGFTKLLDKHQEESEKRKDYLEKIQQSSQILLSIINNVLEMARIEKGSVELDETVWSAEQFNDTLYSIFNEMMGEKRIEFVRSIDVKHNYVYCDPIKLREVFINILSNAYKYTPSGGKVEMRLEELPCDEEGYVFYKTTISDTGIGMSKEFLPHIFEEFTREVNSTDNKIEGTGLGMPIVKKLVAIMHGDITVESEKGVGSTFTVIIPHRIATPDNSVEHVDAEIDARDFIGKRILLAEDNDLNAEIAIEILSEVGFVVERACDGIECINMLERERDGYYDLILMDIQMPKMNGYDTTIRIRSMEDDLKAQLPILAMTANAFEEDRRQALKVGMNGHLAKPINIRDLFRELANLL